MKIKQLYEKYDVMPQLAEHQLRVGGIVKLMTDDRDAILAGLVHDMGNLAKFKLIDNEWKTKQQIFRKKYGNNAHKATLTILEDAGLMKLREYIEEESKLYENMIKRDQFEDVSMPALLTLYGDSRVAIDGVTTIMERIVDLETRYGKKRNDRIWAPKLEDYVQSITIVDIRKITENDVKPLFGELLSYNI